MPGNTDQSVTTEKTETPITTIPSVIDKKFSRRVKSQRHIQTQKSLDDEHKMRSHLRIKKNSNKETH